MRPTTQADSHQPKPKPSEQKAQTQPSQTTGHPNKTNTPKDKPIKRHTSQHPNNP